MLIATSGQTMHTRKLEHNRIAASGSLLKLHVTSNELMRTNIQNKNAGIFVANIVSNAHSAHNITYISKSLMYRPQQLDIVAFYINTGRYLIDPIISIIISEFSDISQIYFFQNSLFKKPWLTSESFRHILNLSRDFSNNVPILVQSYFKSGKSGKSIRFSMICTQARLLYSIDSRGN